MIRGSVLNKLFVFKAFVILSIVLSILNAGVFSYVPIEIARVFLLAILFLFFPFEIRLSKMHLLLMLFILIYLFVFQVGSAIGLSFIEGLRDSLYPIEDNVWEVDEYAGVTSLQENRYAGIFYNPNIMGQNMVLLFCLFLAYFKIKKPNIILIIVSIVILLSTVLTGSRTAIFTLLILFFFYFRKYLTVNGFIFIASILGVIVLVKLDGILNYLENFRSFNISSLYGEDLSSGSAKLHEFNVWFEQFQEYNFSTISTLIFGVAAITLQVDFDFGYILQVLGLFGFLMLLFFFIQAYQRTQTQFRFVFWVFLISIGATLIINFRFSILLMMILSSFYNLDENKREV
jgi:hypothetical protein